MAPQSSAGRAHTGARPAPQPVRNRHRTALQAAYAAPAGWRTDSRIGRWCATPDGAGAQAAVQQDGRGVEQQPARDLTRRNDLLELHLAEPIRRARRICTTAPPAPVTDWHACRNNRRTGTGMSRAAPWMARRGPIRSPPCPARRAAAPLAPRTQIARVRRARNASPSPEGTHHEHVRMPQVRQPAALLHVPPRVREIRERGPATCGQLPRSPARTEHRTP
jgi:hypothetical protein